MAETKLNKRYQIVIPKEIREKIELQPNTKFLVKYKDGIVFLIPNLSLKELKGKLPKLDRENLRDKEY